MAPRPKTSALNVRITADEMEYLTSLADELEVTLSEALRAAIARSLLRDVEHGEREADEDFQWVARNARTVSASPLDGDGADPAAVRPARPRSNAPQ